MGYRACVPPLNENAGGCYDVFAYFKLRVVDFHAWAESRGVCNFDVCAAPEMHLTANVDVFAAFLENVAACQIPQLPAQMPYHRERGVWQVLQNGVV